MFFCLLSRSLSIRTAFTHGRLCSSTATNTGPSLLNAFTERSHTCGQLRLQDVGKRVKICGWLAYKRLQKKNTAFLVLRDAYGQVQALVPKQFAPALANLHVESSLCVEGPVVDRGERNRNPGMDTGDIEVLVERLEVLNATPEQIPLHEHAVSGVTKQRHRYLDLRWPSMQKALRLRAKIVAGMRRVLEGECGFVDIQTPTLAHFTPGGATEFLVPAASNGACFSLPQSPQIYKQLLMCGGMDRYYQVAICYRDEKLTPFRQAEFVQLDLELSFTSQEAVMALVELVVQRSWPEEELGPRPAVPFPRLTFAEAVAKYGTDKPDLRIPWEIVSLPHPIAGKPAKMFTAPRAMAHLDADAETIASWHFWIGHLPEREDYAILGADPVPELLEGDECLRQLNASRAEGDAIVVCWGHSARNVLEVLGRLRNFVAEAVGLRRSPQFHFLWVHKFPLFTRNGNDGKLEATHHPFTAPIPEHLERLKAGEDLEGIEAQHYDLVLNGVEVGGGSIRLHQAEVQRHVLERVLRLDSSHLQHLLNALSCGAPPHGGFALGLDRYVAILNARGDPNASIRGVIAFPKGGLGQCHMSGSPAVPSEQLLARYGLERRREAVEAEEEKPEEDEEGEEEEHGKFC